MNKFQSNEQKEERRTYMHVAAEHEHDTDHSGRAAAAARRAYGSAQAAGVLT
jgi:hypothetical protein